MNRNPKHTPGPWHTGGSGTIIYDAEGWGVANATVFHGRREPGQSVINARLIAAAPDLLEALQWAEARLEELGEHTLVGKCAAAIGKATREVA